VAAPGQAALIVVKKADGSNSFWDGADLRKRIEFARIGLDLCLSNDEIEAELRRSVYDQISQKDLDATIVLNSKTLIERDADFAKFAGRIQLTYIYEEVLGWDIMKDGIGALKAAHQRAFRKYLEHGVAIKRINPRLLDYDLAKLGLALDPSSDLEFDFLGIQTLYDRYLIIDKTRKPSRRIETPQFFWLRVSMGLMLDEKGDRESRVTALYELYKSRRFCSSTPTLFNSGTLHSQLSSCYLYYVDDSLESIMLRGIADNAFLAKWAGGLGGSWTAVRGTGAHIHGTNGESQGVIPFLKLHNDQLVAVNQGGKRKGSGCAYLETWHNDIFEFLELRKNTGDDRRRTHDMNTANWIPDLFMKRMEDRKHWTLFRSNQVEDLHELYGAAFEKRYLEYEQLAEEGKIVGQKIEALELWKKMLSMLFETGHPWITFKDACNLRSPQDHVGVIHSSNLCTEITLNTSNDETAVCNLGSVILETHLKADGSLDHDKLRETIRIAIRALDNVIDINFYPTPSAKTSNLRHRPIGMGVMGLAHALYLRGHAFASPEAVDFNDEAMEAIAYYAYEASSDLAAERGTYSSYKGSKWDRGLLPQDTIDILEKERGVAVDVVRGGKMDWTPLRAKIAKQGMRNSNCLAIAPTATISNITATSPCIEPTYKNLFVKSNLSRRVHRSESLPREGPQGPRSLGSGHDRQPEVLRWRVEGHRAHSGRPEGEVPHGVRHRCQVDPRCGGAPPEVDRPGAIGEPLDQDARSQDAESHVPPCVARGTQDHLLSPQPGCLEHREGHGRGEERSAWRCGRDCRAEEGLLRGGEKGLLDRGDAPRRDLRGLSVISGQRRTDHPGPSASGVVLFLAAAIYAQRRSLLL
jgi:ribonucleoside-diphosphate reductase alpha chain